MSSDDSPPDDLRARFEPVPGLIETDLDSELVLLDPATQQMFSLNPSGRALWNALREHTAADAAARVAREFDIALDRATDDALALLADLLDAGLLRRVDR